MKMMNWLMIGSLAVAGVAIAQNTPATQPSSPDDVLDRLLQPDSAPTPAPLQPSRPAGPAIDRTTGGGAVAPGAEALPVMREGSFIVDRTGRLTRGADGVSWQIAFEADGKALQDPPMILLPNLKLMAMEDAVRSTSRDLRFRVTGVVTEYRGRNYLLLEKVVVLPDQRF